MHTKPFSVQIYHFALILNQQAQLLILQSKSGKWTLPGDFLYFKDEIETSFLDTLKNQTNLNCSSPKPYAVNVMQTGGADKYCTYFTVSVENEASINLNDTFAQFKWISGQDVMNLEFENSKIAEVILQYLAWMVYFLKKSRKIKTYAE